MRRLTDASFVQSAEAPGVADSAWNLNSPRRCETVYARVNRHDRVVIFMANNCCLHQGEHLLSARARSLRGGVDDPTGFSGQTSRSKTMCCGTRSLSFPNVCVFRRKRSDFYNHSGISRHQGYFSTARNWVTSASRATGVPQLQGK